MQDEANQRKTQPVYDALDNGDPKLALSLADKLLKKSTPGDFTHRVKALKGLAVARLRQTDHGLELLESVRAENPSDYATLRAMEFAYRECNRPDLIRDMYITAAEKSPTDMEVLLRLLEAHIRVGDLAKQQTLALKMAKVKPEFLFWAAHSLFMQAKDPAKETVAQSMLLPLCVRILGKAEASGGIKTLQHMLFYLDAAAAAAQWSLALRLLHSPLGKLVQPAKLKNELEADFLEKAEKWEEALEKRILLVESDGNNWSYWTQLFALEKREELSEVSRTRVGTLLRTMVERESAKERPERGVFLAELEECIGGGEERIEALMDLLVAYVKRFSSKLSCFIDIRSALHRIPVAHRDGLYARLKETHEQGAALADVAGYQRMITVEKCRRCLGLEGRVSALVETYRLGLPLGNAFDARERQVTDDVLLMAVQQLVDEHALKVQRETLEEVDSAAASNKMVVVREGSSAELLSAMVLLREGLSHSKHNFQFALLHMRLLALLGAVQPALDVYHQLEVKHIQLDSISFLFCDFALRGGYYELGLSETDRVLDFFVHSTRDIVERGIIRAHSEGSFSKLTDFYRFRDRNGASVSRALANIDECVLRLLQPQTEPSHTALREYLCASSLLADPVHATDAYFAALIDNRDQSVADSFEPVASHVFPHHLAVRLEAKLLFAQTRTAALRCAAVCANPLYDATGLSEAKTHLETLMERLRTHEKDATTHTIAAHRLVSLEDPTAVYLRLWSCVLLPIVSAVQLLMDMTQTTDDHGEWSVERAEAPVPPSLNGPLEQFDVLVAGARTSLVTLWESVSRAFVRALDVSVDPHSRVLPNLGAPLTVISASFEVSALCFTLVSTVCRESLFPATLGRKPRKRIMAGQTGSKLYGPLNEFKSDCGNAFGALVSALGSASEQLDLEVDANTLSDLLNGLTVSDESLKETQASLTGEIGASVRGAQSAAMRSTLRVATTLSEVLDAFRVF